MKKQLKISIGDYSSAGRKEINQDFHDIRIPKEPQLTSKGIAIALADGISSSHVSQIASKTAVVSFLTDYFSTPISWSIRKSAERVLTATNSWLNSQTSKSKYTEDKNRGYVCTFSAMVIHGSTAHIFHIGDTRIYRLRGNNIEQLTNDHRLWVSHDKSYLGRALGIESQISVDYESFEVEKEDIFLFMTDGIYEFLESETMKETILECEDDFHLAAQSLVTEAFNEGSSENLTVQIVRVDELGDKIEGDLKLTIEKKEAPHILQEGESFDGYTILKQISITKRSHVYLAVNDETKVKVVIKTPSVVMQNDKAYLEHFLMEEWIALRINNPHVAKAYLQTRKRNYIYTVWEYIEGETLSQWMLDNPKPSMEEVRTIVEQLAKGVQAFHRLEMIHQDIRPENILIDKDANVKIIDFGSTKIGGILDIQSYIRDDMIGSVHYSAPEYFSGNVGSFSSDIFSLGVIVYQMLSGKLPYGEEMASATSKSAQKKLQYKCLFRKNKKVPVWIDETLKKAVAIDVSQRYEELSEFTYDLRHPNEIFLKKARRPFFMKNPTLLWKLISLVLFVAFVAQAFFDAG
jgi:protein phosphatase